MKAMLILEADCARPGPGQLGYLLHRLSERLGEGKGLLEFAANRLARQAEVFDFGTLPDGVIRSEAKRAGPLLGRGLLSTPFDACCFWYTLGPSDGWMESLAPVREALGALWTPDFGPRRYASCAVRLIPPGHHCETQTFLVADYIELCREEKAILGLRPSASLYTFDSVGLVNTKADGTWEGTLLYAQAEELATEAEVTDPDILAKLRSFTLGSLADGVASCSMLLCTRGIRTRVEPAPAKLNAKRARSGKEALPRVTFVDTLHYLEASKNAALRGTHASPVPHLRRGHVRHYRSGREVWIRDALVNCRSLEEVAARDHYEVR